MARGILIGAALGVVTLSGCEALLSDVKYEQAVQVWAVGDGAVSDASDADASDGNAPSPVGEIPSGWIGPVVLRTGTAAEYRECDGIFGEPYYRGYAEPSSAAIDCECTCGDAATYCLDLKVELFAQTDCAGSAAHTHTTAVDNYTDCIASGDDFVSARFSGGRGEVTCAAGSAPKEEPELPSSVVACGPPSLQGLDCGDDAECERALASACIFRPNAVKCPDGRFTERRVYAKSYDDSRECTVGSCACGELGSASCDSAIFDAYGDPECANGGHLAAASSLVEADCLIGLTVNSSYGLSLRTPETANEAGSCDASGEAEATGTLAMSEQETTFCCIPEE